MARPIPLPESVRTGVEAAWAEGGGGARLVAVEPVGGGCIHRAVRVRGDDGRRAFLKWSPGVPGTLFPSEAEGLQALARSAEATGLRIPAVVGYGGGGDVPGWLLMEWLEPGPTPPGGGARLGRGLARLHEPLPGGWGWSGSNHIGPLPQDNTPTERWSDFWRERRLEPLLRRCVEAGAFERRADREAWERVLDGVGAWLAIGEQEGPSLLHGDLWSGNVFFTGDGQPALVDPAVYRGHREVDLAMLELFGGIPEGTLEAYREEAPPAPGDGRARRDLYQLHPLLVHLVLFGRGYEAAVLERVRRLARGQGSPPGREDGGFLSS